MKDGEKDNPNKEDTGDIDQTKMNHHHLSAKKVYNLAYLSMSPHSEMLVTVTVSGSTVVLHQ